MITQEGQQAIKTREDQEPILFGIDGDGNYRLSEGQEASWLKDGETFDTSKLRERIEPWLTSLFQTEHFSLLLGSGLTEAIHRKATGEGATGMDAQGFTTFKEKIDQAAKESANEANRSKGNFEDQLRVANELIRGIELYCINEGESEDETIQSLIQEKNDLANEIQTLLGNFSNSILQDEKKIIEQAVEDNALNYLVNFLMSFASRTGTRDRLHIFTTNYDRLIETGSELAGLHLLDRFIGDLKPIFRASRMNIDMHYDPPGIRGEPRYLEGVARFTKLHGSLDWFYSNGEVHKLGVPFGATDIKPFINVPGLEDSSMHNLMIYPNEAKDRDTAGYPYVELFRDFAAANCRPNSTLVTYGYGFADSHINRVIEDMLSIPSTHLVIISYNDNLGTIKQFYDRIGRPAQISLLIGNHLGNIENLVNNYLPKPAIDKVTSRMEELLRKRGYAKSNQSENGQGENEHNKENQNPET